MTAAWRGAVIPAALHVVLLLGIYQLGYTPQEWRDIRAEAGARGITRLQVARERSGVLGYVRAYYMTDSDERMYLEYARLTFRGEVDLAYLTTKKHQEQGEVHGRPWPYRDVHIEYPPVGLLVMLPPALVTLDYAGYRFWLGAWLTSLHLLNLWLAWRAFAPASGIPTLARLAWYSLAFSFLLGNIVVTRIDPAVATCILAAAAAFRQSLDAPARTALWAGAAGVLAAVGFLTKLVPALVVPAVVVGYLTVQPRSRATTAVVACVGGFIATLALATTLSLMFFGRGYVDTFTYHLNRGISIDSTYGGVLMAVRGAGVPMPFSRAFGSINIDTRAATTLTQVSPIVVGVLCSIVLAIGFRMRDRLNRSAFSEEVAVRTGYIALGLLLAFMIGNKVFAPQYLMWVATLALAVSVGRRGEGLMAGLLMAAAACTQVFYPRGFRALQDLRPAMIGALNLRNALVVAMLVVTVARLAGWRPSAANGSRSAPEPRPLR